MNLKPLVNSESGFAPKLISTLREGYNAAAPKAVKLNAPVFLTGALGAHVRREFIKFGIKKPLLGYGHNSADCKNAIRYGHEIDEPAE